MRSKRVKIMLTKSFYLAAKTLAREEGKSFSAWAREATMRSLERKN